MTTKQWIGKIKRSIIPRPRTFTHGELMVREKDRLETIVQITEEWPELGRVLSDPQADRFCHQTIMDIYRDLYISGSMNL